MKKLTTVLIWLPEKQHFNIVNKSAVHMFSVIMYQICFLFVCQIEVFLLLYDYCNTILNKRFHKPEERIVPIRFK